MDLSSVTAVYLLHILMIRNISFKDVESITKWIMQSCALYDSDIKFYLIFLLAVLLFHPSHGSEALSCCPWVYTPVSSKHGWYSFRFLSVDNWFCCVLVSLDPHLLVIRLSQVILGEEVAASKLTIFDIAKQICDAVQARAGQGLIMKITYERLCNHVF